MSLCGLAAIGLLSVGILALLSPERLARSYGVPVKDRGSLAYVRSTGVRDLILGLVFLTMIGLRDGIAMLVLCIAGIVLSLADFSIAFSTAKRLHSEHGAHIGGAIGFIVLTALLLRS